MEDFEQRFDIFTDTIFAAVDEDLLILEREAIADDVPIIRKDAQRFLRWFLSVKKPQSILEVGTAVGFSALLMARELPEVSIDTIENYPPRLRDARKNFASFVEGKRIRLLEGDAAEVLDGLTDEDKYDFVFIDAAKGQYSDYFNKVIPHLNKDAVIICDNILQEGRLLDSRFAVRRRDRTIHERMRQFLHEAADHSDFKSDFIPVGDGLLLMAYNRRLR